MEDVLFARAQMAMSLGFHIIFAAIGIAMPVFMVLAEMLWRRTGDADYLALAKRWSKGTAVFFAVGAVSGTVLSFELGLLFPGFMRHAGAIVGFPFSLEGFAFFTEAIFLGIYLYGWDRVSPRLHIAAGVVVAASGMLSALFVTLVNAWMNAPVGFRLQDGRLVDIDPIAGLTSPFALHEVLHTLLACYMTTAFAMIAIHAYGLLRSPHDAWHRKAYMLACFMAVPCALAQPLVGHYAGQQVAVHQPMKLAAMEGLRETQTRAPLTLGPLTLPGGLSFLAFNDFDAEVQGLEAFPEADWPSGVVRVAFLIMVLLGTLMAAYAGLLALLTWRRRAVPTSPPWLWAGLALGPAALVAMQAGWVVTEVGRQPWVIYGVLRTRDAATPMPGLAVPFVTFSLVYLLLGLVVLAVLRREVRRTLPGGTAP